MRCALCTLRQPEVGSGGVFSCTVLLSSQRPGTAAGEVAAADANVAPPTKGHRSCVWAEWLLQGPG